MKRYISFILAVILGLSLTACGTNNMEGTPVAEELASRGYQSFVVNYRLRPYTQEEGALDLARAVRFVRKHADAVEAAGVRVERLQLDGRPHGFGYQENWFDAYDDFLTEIFTT